MKSSEPDIFQNIVRWAILIFFVYAAWHTYSGNQKPPAQVASTQQVAEVKKETNCDKPDRYSLFTSSLLPLITSAVNIKDVKPGVGEPAFCGQKATFTYEYKEKEKVVKKGENTAIIGSGAFPQGLEMSLIGMKPGGVRDIIVPPEFMETKEKTDKTSAPKILQAQLTLEKTSPALPSSAFPLHVITDQFGAGKEAECGDSVSADITLWKTDGTKLFASDKPIAFVLGKSEMPLGIEQAVTGMPEGSGRLVVMPPSYQPPLIKTADSTSSLLPTLPDEILMVQIDNLHIENPHTIPLQKAADMIKNASPSKPQPAEKPADKPTH